jgi:hypothetical protein
MSQKRFEALAAELVGAGHLGTDTSPMSMLAYEAPATTIPHWRVADTDPARIAAQAVINGWDWVEKTAQQEERLKAKRLQKLEKTANLILLRAAFRVVLNDRNATRDFLVAVRQQIIALGGTLPAAPASRTWQQFLSAVEAEIDAGGGD